MILAHLNSAHWAPDSALNPHWVETYAALFTQVLDAFFDLLSWEPCEAKAHPLMKSVFCDAHALTGTPCCLAF